MPDSGSVRRRQAGVLVVGATEREVHPWLRAAGHATRVAADAKSALAALGEEPADLVIVDRDPGGLDTPDLCRALHADPRLDGAWMLAITAKGSRSDAALAAGADDYLHRPFTRGELLARAGAGLRAARQRSDDRLMRALMLNVPGAIYRSAWHAGHVVELISDEIERIAGYLPSNFVASTRRTLLSIVHPDDREMLERAVQHAAEHERAFAVEYRIVRADGEVRWVLDRGQVVPGSGGRLWIDGAMFDITERRAAEEALREREIERARTEELRASRARIVEAADAARRRIERDLHDGAQQRLVLVSLTLKRAEARAKGTPAEEVVAEASDAAARGAGRAARPRPRDPSGGARRARPRRRARRPRRPLPVPGRGARRARARGARRRGGDLLHDRRGAHERGQVRAGDPGVGHDRDRGRHAGGRGHRRRRRRRDAWRAARACAASRTASTPSAARSPCTAAPAKGTTIRACAPLDPDGVREGCVGSAASRRPTRARG